MSKASYEASVSAGGIGLSTGKYTTDNYSGKILLHACCAPCSGAIVEYLVNRGVRPVIFFSNSNITPFHEYSHRLNECIRYAKEFGLEVVGDNYDHDFWLTCAAGLETEPERGARCLECFKHRLLRAA